MPGPVLHTLLGRDACSLLLNPDARAAITGEWNAYLWGLQGGDLYYYPASRRKGYSLNGLGLSFHLLKTAGMFTAMCEYVRRLFAAQSPEYPLMRAYVAGFLGHYALDSQIHSYVFPMEREYRRTHPAYDEEKEGGLHGRLEKGIEWILFQCRRQPGETMAEVTHPYRMDDGLLRTLSNFYTALSMELYGIDAGRESMRLCVDCAFEAFQDRPEEKNVFIEDQMNFMHRQWEVYDTPGCFLCSSVPELYEKAMRQATSLMDELEACLQSGETFRPQIQRNCSYWRYDDPAWFREMYQF